MDSRNRLLGIDIGGTKIAVCVGNREGSILASDRLHGAAQRPYDEILPELVGMCRKVVRETGCTLEEVSVCGISTPGPIDLEQGCILKTPNMIWSDVPIREDISRALGVKTVMQNDANAGVLVEWFFGVARGCPNVMYFTMSTGIGGGIIAGGHLVQGRTGNAGEVGHVVLDVDGPLCGCGMHGCFEAFCGGRNVARQLAERFGSDPRHPIMRMPEVNGDGSKLNYQTLREGVKRGIPDAVEFWDRICLRMAQGLGVFMNTLNPELIVLGTTFYYSGEIGRAHV